MNRYLIVELTHLKKEYILKNECLKLEKNIIESLKCVTGVIYENLISISDNMPNNYNNDEKWEIAKELKNYVNTELSNNNRYNNIKNLFDNAIETFTYRVLTENKEIFITNYIVDSIIKKIKKLENEIKQIENFLIKVNNIIDVDFYETEEIEDYVNELFENVS